MRPRYYASLALNALVAEVARLLGSDATIRNVTLRLDLAPGPALVRGDRIQIQQAC